MFPERQVRTGPVPPLLRADRLGPCHMSSQRGWTASSPRPSGTASPCWRQGCAKTRRGIRFSWAAPWSGPHCLHPPRRRVAGGIHSGARCPVRNPGWRRGGRQRRGQRAGQAVPRAADVSARRGAHRAQAAIPASRNAHGAVHRHRWAAVAPGPEPVEREVIRAPPREPSCCQGCRPVRSSGA